MPLGMEVGLGPGDIVLDWDPASPPPSGTASPQFSAHVYCLAKPSPHIDTEHPKLFIKQTYIGLAEYRVT